MEINPWNPNIWFSPCHIINTLSASVSNKKTLKRHKEAWICAVTMICHSALHPNDHVWWIQVPKNDPPDVLAMQLIPRKDGKGNELSLVKVEVFEIRDFKKESIEDAIRRKLSNKDYSHTILIGFVRKACVFDHVTLAENMQKLNPAIQILGLIVFEDSRSTCISFIQLFPTLSKFKADFGLHCRTTKQRSFVELKRGMKAEGKKYISDSIPTVIP